MISPFSFVCIPEGILAGEQMNRKSQKICGNLFIDGIISNPTHFDSFEEIRDCQYSLVFNNSNKSILMAEEPIPKSYNDYQNCNKNKTTKNSNSL